MGRGLWSSDDDDDNVLDVVVVLEDGGTISCCNFCNINWRRIFGSKCCGGYVGYDCGLAKCEDNRLYDTIRTLVVRSAFVVVVAPMRFPIWSVSCMVFRWVVVTAADKNISKRCCCCCCCSGNLLLVVVIAIVVLLVRIDGGLVGIWNACTVVVRLVVLIVVVVSESEYGSARLCVWSTALGAVRWSRSTTTATTTNHRNNNTTILFWRSHRSSTSNNKNEIMIVLVSCVWPNRFGWKNQQFYTAYTRMIYE